MSIDERLRTFVAWHGEIPSEANRIDDAEAREHAATWIRRNLGDGVAGAYVIGYRLGERWWTLFFERTSIYQPYPEGAERWHIEAYDHNGRSWIGNYYYWPAENRWRHVFYRLHGDDYGRYSQAGEVLGPAGSVVAEQANEPSSEVSTQITNAAGKTT